MKVGWCQSFVSLVPFVMPVLVVIAAITLFRASAKRDR